MRGRESPGIRGTGTGFTLGLRRMAGASDQWDEGGSTGDGMASGAQPFCVINNASGCWMRGKAGSGTDGEAVPTVILWVWVMLQAQGQQWAFNR